MSSVTSVGFFYLFQDLIGSELRIVFSSILFTLLIHCDLVPYGLGCWCKDVAFSFPLILETFSQWSLPAFRTDGLRGQAMITVAGGGKGSHMSRTGWREPWQTVVSAKYSILLPSLH